MKTCVINSIGLTTIRDLLGTYHKLGYEHFTDSMLRKWAEEAENHYNDGLGCYFQIKYCDSKIGYTVELHIDADGYDLRDVIA